MAQTIYRIQGICRTDPCPDWDQHSEPGDPHGKFVTQTSYLSVDEADRAMIFLHAVLNRKRQGSVSLHEWSVVPEVIPDTHAD